MSNECDITVMITGPEPFLTTFKNIGIRYEPYIFDLERLHPNPFNDTSEGIAIDLSVPFELDQRTKWFHENFGTTNPCCFKEIENSDEKYIVQFLTDYPTTTPPAKAAGVQI